MGAKRRRSEQNTGIKAVPGTPAPRRLFALDQNFPEPIVASMEEFIESAELVPVRRIGPKFSTLEDWELLLALNNHHREWDGLITSDASMLKVPRVVSVLVQTKLTIVVAHGQGDNPVRATGVVLAHIDHICHNTDKRKPQVWFLGVTQKPHEEAWDYLKVIAQRRGVSTTELFNKHKIDKSLIKSWDAEVSKGPTTRQPPSPSHRGPQSSILEHNYSVQVNQPSVGGHSPSNDGASSIDLWHKFPSW